MLVVDLLHEFELGVWKAVLTHLLRILHATKEKDRVQIFNKRRAILHQTDAYSQYILGFMMFLHLVGVQSDILPIMS